jgi:hypothetical protein
MPALIVFYCRAIAACRLVIRLQDFRNRDVCIGEDCSPGNTKNRLGQRRSSRSINPPIFRPAGASQIRVTTSRIMMEDM